MFYEGGLSLERKIGKHSRVVVELGFILVFHFSFLFGFLLLDHCTGC